MPTDDNLHKIDESINKGVDYLCEHQLANGEFMTYWGPDEMLQEYCVPSSTTYTTCIIANALIPFKSHPKVAILLKKSVGFIQYQMMRGGVWQFLSKTHQAFKYLPPDVDDTALASVFLINMGIGAPDNLPMLLSNRNKDGLFYTWFTWRINFSIHKNYLLLLLREFKDPIRNLLYWKNNEISRNDIDAAINANVLLYLGNIEVAKPIVKWVVKLIKEKKEIIYDKYYRNPIVAFYFFSRLFSLNIQELEDLRHLLVEKVIKCIEQKENFYNNDLEMALSISTLINLNYNYHNLFKIAEKLIENQSTNGEWRRSFFYGIPSNSVGYGCEELTTALAVEALHAYKNYTNPPIEQE